MSTKLLTWTWGRETTGHKNIFIAFRGSPLIGFWKRERGRWSYGGGAYYTVRALGWALRCDVAERLAKEFAGVD